jgi:hypothetical protein
MAILCFLDSYIAVFEVAADAKGQTLADLPQDMSLGLAVEVASKMEDYTPPSFDRAELKYQLGDLVLQACQQEDQAIVDLCNVQKGVSSVQD